MVHNLVALEMESRVLSVLNETALANEFSIDSRSESLLKSIDNHQASPLTYQILNERELFGVILTVQPASSKVTVTSHIRRRSSILNTGVNLVGAYLNEEIID